LAFLNVESSISGRPWVGPSDATRRAAETIAQNHDLPFAVAAVLARHNISDQEAKPYLNPQLRDLLPDPLRLRDMDKAASRLIEAMLKKQRIAIFADYDVDGATSAALLIDWLKHFGQAATLYIPDRIEEGYGPNETAMQNLGQHHDLIICVDCGTLSHAPVKAAHPAEVIILDHHLGAEMLPQCCAVVNPNRQDEDSDLGHLCAASVVFLCLVEAGRQLRKMDQSGPDLMQMLDLVALATVADVAPLIGVNRAFVRQGLRIMAQRKRLGITALADCANLQSPPSSYHLGFVLGPRINAGGRVGQADLGAKLLICDDPSHAQALAERLEELNQDRKDVEESVRLAAIEQASERGLDGPLVWAAGAGWHPGVVGIVAARLKEATNRPAIVIGFDGNSGKGSGRSVSGIDLGATIQKLVQEGMIEKGGGHKMAAGLSLTEAQLAPAMARLSDLLAKQGSAAGGTKDLQLDALLMASAASLELYEDLEKAGPFGSGTPTPRFGFSDMRLSFAKRVGDQHLKFRAQDPEGTALEGIAFNAFQTALGPALLAHEGKRFHLAGKLNLNIWNGRKSIQLVLDDAAQA